MDMRDKQLQRHMRRRFELASALPRALQCRWAEKCRSLAARQHRTAFYCLASLWLADIEAAGF